MVSQIRHQFTTELWDITSRLCERLNVKALDWHKLSGSHHIFTFEDEWYKVNASVKTLTPDPDGWVDLTLSDEDYEGEEFETRDCEGIYLDDLAILLDHLIYFEKNLENPKKEEKS